MRREAAFLKFSFARSLLGDTVARSMLAQNTDDESMMSRDIGGDLPLTPN